MAGTDIYGDSGVTLLPVVTTRKAAREFAREIIMNPTHPFIRWRFYDLRTGAETFFNLNNIP